MDIALSRRAGRLPSEATSFVERRAESAAIRRQLARSRLVTLLGPGGVGKTRLAIRAGADLRRTFPDGVSFVDLAVVADAELLTETISGLLGVVARPDRAGLDALVEHFAPRRALLVLDNCEHLVDRVSEVVAALLRGCEHLKVIATSRESLGLFAESVLPVHPMTVPGRQPSQAGTAESVRLFVSRARDAYPSFDPSPPDLVLVGEICRHLDGLPLAIELAAVRVRVLSLPQILARLTDRFRLLTGGSRDAPDRHQTLLASIEWSYELCAPAEQLLWERLGVFSGTWELDAAEAVCAGDGIEPDATLDLLQALVDKSIVIRSDDGSGHAYYRMLATIHEFAAERLRRSGQWTARQDRHRDWCAELLVRAEADWISPRQAYWLNRMYRELPNIRAAILHSLAAPGSEVAALRLTVRAWRVCWWAQGRGDELRGWLERILPRVDAAQPLRARGIALQAAMAAVQDQPDSDPAAVPRARKAGQAAGDAVTVALTWYTDGIRATNGGRPDAAVEAFSQAVDLVDADTDRGTVMLMVVMLAIACADAGDAERAEANRRRATALAQRYGDSFELSVLLRNLGESARVHGNVVQAAALVQHSIRLKRDLGDATGLAVGMQTLAFIAYTAGESLRAATLLGAAKVAWDATGATEASFPWVSRRSAEVTTELRAELGVRAFDRARKAGLRLSAAQAVAAALDEPVASPASDTRRLAAAGLTRREAEIAQLLAEGLSNREIAIRLVIALRTAEGHVERILGKLGFTSRSQVSAWLAEAEDGAAADPATRPG